MPAAWRSTRRARAAADGPARSIAEQRLMPSPAYVVGLSVVGLGAGLWLLIRGFAGYRSAGRVSGTSPSRIASLAAGEVLVSGAAEPIEVTLISPLQSQPCPYYRSRLTESRGGDRRD